MLTDTDIQKLTTILTQSLSTVFATKDDLKNLENNLEAKFESKFATKEDLYSLEKRIDTKFENLLNDITDLVNTTLNKMGETEEQMQRVRTEVKGHRISIGNHENRLQYIESPSFKQFMVHDK